MLPFAIVSGLAALVGSFGVISIIEVLVKTRRRSGDNDPLKQVVRAAVPRSSRRIIILGLVGFLPIAMGLFSAACLAYGLRQQSQYGKSVAEEFTREIPAEHFRYLTREQIPFMKRSLYMSLHRATTGKLVYWAAYDPNRVFGSVHGRGKKLVKYNAMINVMPDEVEELHRAVNSGKGSLLGMLPMDSERYAFASREAFRAFLERENRPLGIALSWAWTLSKYFGLQVIACVLGAIAALAGFRLRNELALERSIFEVMLKGAAQLDALPASPLHKAKVIHRLLRMRPYLCFGDSLADGGQGAQVDFDPGESGTGMRVKVFELKLQKKAYAIAVPAIKFADFSASGPASAGPRSLAS